MAVTLGDEDFVLHKGKFRDVLCLRYGWNPHQIVAVVLPSHDHTMV